METDDVVNVPEGSYTYEIVAEVGSKKFTTSYSVEFKNPCTEIPITVFSPTPFADHTYTLLDEMYYQEWIIDDVARNPTDVDCGDMSVTFVDKEGDPIDTSIFNINYDHYPYKFEVKYNDDSSHEGKYEIFYKVQYDDYENSSVTSTDSFEIEIVD